MSGTAMSFGSFPTAAPAKDDAAAQGEGDGDDDDPEKEAPEPEGAPKLPPTLAKLEKVETGEEGETNLALAGGKLYQFDLVTKAWKERGSGTLKVNQKEGKVRMLMRMDVTHTVLLNATVQPARLAPKPQPNKPLNVLFHLVEQRQGAAAPAIVPYSLRCMDAPQAEALLKTLKEIAEKK